MERANTPTLIGVAMLRPDRKSEGVDFLLDCLADLLKEGIDFHYWHIGGGERLPQLAAKAQRLLSDKATFLGPQTRPQIIDWLSRADLFAFPGFDESFGLVYVEAQACGLPVIAFANGGVPDAVAHGRSGLLTPVGDREAMKAALRELILNRKKRLQMSHEARAFALEKFDLNKNYLVIDRLLTSRAGGHFGMAY